MCFPCLMCVYVCKRAGCCSGLSGGQAETDRTHAERETHPAGGQLPLPRPAGALLQGARVDS